MSSKSRLLLPIVLTFLLVVSSTQNVSAAMIDQKQELATGACGFSTSLGQEFKPTMPILEAVEVKLRTLVVPGTDDTITLTIRQGTFDGTILATASKFVTAGFSGWLYFSFNPVSVTPGSTYVIRLQEETRTTFGWQFAMGNPYPNGGTFFGGVPDTDGRDYAFRSYGSGSSSSVGGVVLPTNNLTVLAPYLAMIGLVTVAAAFYCKKRR